MNKAQTERAIEVMQAYLDGKPIEYQRNGMSPEFWIAVNKYPEPRWDWGMFDYRVKPDPIEFEVWYNPNPLRGCRRAVSVKDGGDEAYWKDRGYNKIKMREVQD